MDAAVAMAGQADGVAQVVELSCPVVPVLATGAWFKNTLCITSRRQAFVSAGAGDLDTAEACRAHERLARLLLGLGDAPQAVAHDLHPDFHSTRFATMLADELGVPLIGVQHHHAHIAAVCAEHGFDAPVIGLALDGVGLGPDGAAWGGELLRVDGAAFHRLGHLRPLPLPGGDRAAREPWRMAAAALYALGRGGEIAARFASEPAAATVATMLQREINCPRTSSMGRLFDAAAGLLDVCDRMQFEAQAAIALEQLARHHGPVAPMTDGYRVVEETGQLDFWPLLALLADCDDPAYGAAVFHATLVAGLTAWVARASAVHGIDHVVLGGGCFLNGILSQGLPRSLSATGVHVLAASQLLPGDSAISLGQAWVAMHQLDGNRYAMLTERGTQAA